MSAKKQLLIARLAAIRARLLRQLIGIDEATLTTVPVFADWTAGDLLAHIGEHDRLYGAAVKWVGEGHPGEISIEESGWYEHAHNGTLDQAVERFMVARAEFLDALARLDDPDLRRPYLIRRGTGRGRGTVKSWAMWRYLHESGYMRGLQKWRDGLPETFCVGPKSVLLAALRAAHTDLLESVALVAADERTTRPVCGDWTLKDVLGHLADWDRYFLNWLNAMVGGEVHDLYWDEDSDAFNAYLQAARRDQSWQQIWEDFLAARFAFLSRLESLTQADLERPNSGTLSSFPDAYHCAWSCLEHYLHHTAILRREYGVNIPKYLLDFTGPYT